MLQILLGILIGIFLGYRFIYTKSLFETSILHIINNAASCFASPSLYSLSNPLLWFDLIYFGIGYFILTFVIKQSSSELS